MITTGWDGGERDGDGFDGDGEYVAEEELVVEESDELELQDEDESLPWLESAEDYEEEGASDSAQLMWFIGAGLLALVAIVGGIWWATNRSTDTAMVADGSVIEAPEGDYKEKPEDPGGLEVAGTGNVAPGVAEGRQSEGRIADGSGSGARPSIDTNQGGGNAGSAQAPASGGVGVQVAAYSSKAAAEKGWRELTGRYDALSGFKYRIVQGQADIGTVYRLQAVAGSRSAANQLCSKLKSAGGSCQVK